MTGEKRGQGGLSRIKDLEDEVQTLRDGAAELKKENVALNREAKKVEKLKVKEDELKELKKSYTALEKENKKREKAKEGEDTSAEDLQKKFDELQEENKKVVEEKNKLQPRKSYFLLTVGGFALLVFQWGSIFYNASFNQGFQSY